MSDFRSREQHFDDSPSTPEQKIRKIFNRQQAAWGIGQNIHDYHTEAKRNGEFIVKKHTFLDEGVFQLGVDLVRKGKTTPESWVAWMQNVDMYDKYESVSLHFCGKFFADEAKKRFEEIISSHFGKPVKFFVDSRVRDRVYA